MKTSFIFRMTGCALAAGALLSTLPLLATGDNRLQDTRSVLDQWVETRQLTSKEKTDWRVERSILNDTKTLLTGELERLTEALEELEASATVADEARTELAAQREELLAASGVIESSVAELETQIKGIIATFPEPLVATIRPLIRRLPADPAESTVPLGERVQNIVGILSQADRFNNTITQTSESLEIAEGRFIEVRTLYWGLAMAYYVDTSGEYAGIGMPAEGGWEWPRVPGAGPAIRRLMDVYEGSESIQFIELPARIR